MKSTPIRDFTALKKTGQKIVILTCYDYPTASILDDAGIDIALVGDSLGTNVLGYDGVADVSLDDMVHHLRAVRRGIKHAFVLCDMPYHTYETPEAAIANAQTLVDNGADGIKLEGGSEMTCRITALVKAGYFVCGHIGYTPQNHDCPHVMGKNQKTAQDLVSSAHNIQNAGAHMIVLELVTLELAAEITRILTIPTIGIGSGPHCDGQVQVVNDIIGLSAKKFKHAHRFAEANSIIRKAFVDYKNEVRNSSFPTVENASQLEKVTVGQLREWIDKKQW